MTDATTITIGQRIGAWEDNANASEEKETSNKTNGAGANASPKETAAERKASVDPNSKRAVVNCPCQNTHVFSTDNEICLRHREFQS